MRVGVNQMSDPYNFDCAECGQDFQMFGHSPGCPVGEKEYAERNKRREQFIKQSEQNAVKTCPLCGSSMTSPPGARCTNKGCLNAKSR